MSFLKIKENTQKLDPSILIEPFENGWWYSAIHPGNLMVATVFTDSDLVTKQLYLKDDLWHKFLLCAPKTNQRLKYWKSFCIFNLSASSSIITSLYGNMWTCAGDAICTFNPLSSNGILNALETGAKSALTITNYLSGNDSSLQKYSNEMLFEYKQYIIDKNQYYRLENRWKNYPFWARRQTK